MAFTGTEVDLLANAFAFTASAHRDSVLTLALINMAARERWTAIGSPALTIDLTTLSTPPLVAGTAEYVLSTREIDQVKTVAYRRTATSAWDYLTPISEPEKSLYDQDSATPRYWYEYRPAGVQTFGVAPKPNAASVVAGATLRFEVEAPLPDITALTDTIYLPRTELSAVAHAVASFYSASDGEVQRALTEDGMATRAANMSAEDRLKIKLQSKNLNPNVLLSGDGIQPGPMRWRYTP